MAKSGKKGGGKKRGGKGGQKAAGDLPPGEGRSEVEGRSDGGQEKVIRLESLATKVDYLVGLKRAAETAATDLSEAIKKVAEDAGLEAKTVRSFVAARAGERFEERKRDAKQLALCFDEVGE